MSLAKEDIADLDIIDAEELGADGTSSFKTVPGTDVVSGNVQLNPANDFEGLEFGDDPVEANDLAVLTGATAGDGTYTVLAIVDNTNLTVNEAIPDSTGGSWEFRHPAGALKVGVDPTSLSFTAQNNLQGALEDLSAGSGLDPTAHRAEDVLVHELAEDAHVEMLYTGNKVTSVITWTDNGKTQKIREETITYTGNKVTQVEVQQYDGAGAAIVGEKLTSTLTYTGNNVTSIDEVDMSIFKYIRGIVGLDVMFDAGNSTTTPLLSDTSFTGVGIETTDYNAIIVNVEASGNGGMLFQFSTDNVNWATVNGSSFTYIAANGLKVYHLKPVAKYFRFVWSNSGQPNQTFFRVQTRLSVGTPKASTIRVGTAGIFEDDDAEVVKSVLVGKDVSTYRDVRVDANGDLILSGLSALATEATVAGLLTDTQLRATPVPVSAASLPLPTGAATEVTLAALAAEDFATQTTLAALLAAFNAEDFATETKLEAVRVLLASLDGKDFATQTTLSTLLTDAQLRATPVPVGDGGGSLTVDGPLTDAELRASAVPVSMASAPLPTGAATEATLAALAAEDFATQTTLAALLAAFNAEDFASETTLAALNAAFAAEDFASETTLATLATEAKLEAVRLLLASLDAKDFATETTLAALNAAFGAEDFASETTLAAFKAAFDARDLATETTLAAAEAHLGSIDSSLDVNLSTRATEATQLTLLTEADFDAKLGEPVATPVATTVLGRMKQAADDFASLLSRIPAALVGGRFTVDIGSWFGSTLSTLGQKIMDQSIPVTMASDQSPIQVSISAAAADGALAEFVTNGGSEDMVVNGAGTPVTFSVLADPTTDIVLNSIRVVLSATSIDFDGSSFGKGSELTNGVEVKITADNGSFVSTLLILKLNEDFFRLLDVTTAQPPSGHILAASLAFGGDVRLVAGTSDKVEIVINDNLTIGSLGVNYFTGTVYGILDL